jgi:hypothetical protein
MPKKPKSFTRYTLWIGDIRLAVVVLDTRKMEKKPQKTLRDAAIECWRFVGGDPFRLVGRNISARPPTEEECEMWDVHNEIFGKQFLVFGPDETRGTA